MELIEPQIHSHITDVLPDNHPLAFDQVGCTQCNILVHAANNECMQTWIETGAGNFCMSCFLEIYGTDLAILNHELGINKTANSGE